MKNQILYVVYGNNLNYQIETKLSILSVLRQTQHPNFMIRVMTDQPEDYTGWPVEVVPLDECTLKKWLGNTDYHYRRKAVGLLEALPYAEKTVFLDTDTLVKADANQLFTFRSDEILVDEVDGVWQNMCLDPLIAKVSDYLIKNYPQFDLSLELFNSGVLGFHQDNAFIIKQAIALIDELWPLDHDCRVLEQFCLALSVNNQKTLVEQEIIYHYWSKKEFFHQMGKYFFDKYGYQYQEDLPEKSKEIPSSVIRPSALNRFMFRLKARSFPKKLRSGVLKLLFALTLSADGYEGRQKIAYWLQAMNKDFLRYNPKIYKEFKEGKWPNDFKHLASIKRQQIFLQFLKDHGLID